MSQSAGHGSEDPSGGRKEGLKVSAHELGMGSCCRVFQGVLHESKTHSRKVAVKYGGPKSPQAIENEHRVLNHIRNDPHRNVVRDFNVDFEGIQWHSLNSEQVQSIGERGFLVLENAGKTLKQLLHDDDEFAQTCTYRRMILIFIEIAKGLQHLEENSIVHSDLKPTNILINDEGRVKIADFGLSHIRRTRIFPWRLSGTFGYIAPELFYPRCNETELRITDGIDVFSFGVVMLECLTRKHPFQTILDRTSPDLWRTIDQLCGHRISSGDKAVVGTDDPKVKQSLLELLDQSCHRLMLPLPPEFSALVKGGSGDDVDEGNVLRMRKRLEEIKKQPWDQSHSFPWPPVLCILILVCFGYIEDGQHSVTRPNGSQLALRLKDMLKEPWIDDKLPWVQKECHSKALSMELEPGSCCICELGKPVGEGAYGSVYKGLYKDTSNKVHKVALKLTDRLEEERAAQAVWHEVELLGRIGKDQHRNVLECIGWNAGSAFLETAEIQTITMGNKNNFVVFEYLPMNLEQLLYDDDVFARTCTYRKMLRLFVDIANGLRFLHRRGIVHFDLKPSNVLIDEQGHAKVVDFGVSKIRSDWSVKGTFRGSKAYMAPEIREVHEISDAMAIPKSVDIYSLGIMMEEFLARKRPLDNRDANGESGTSTGGTSEKQPDRLCLLIQKCLNTGNGNGGGPVERPSALLVVTNLEIMLDSEWADDLLPWVNGWI